MLHLGAAHVSFKFYLQHLINHPLNTSQLMHTAVVLSLDWKVHKSVLLHISPAQWALKKKIREKLEGKAVLGNPRAAAGVAWMPVMECDKARWQ